MHSERAEPRVAVIIEDDDDIRHLLETVLTQAGFQTVGRSNGVDGVEAVRTFRPVVTTLDVNMPGIDGFEAAKRIRSFSPTYLIMLTARDEEVDTLMGLQAGADDYVTKPFRPRELRARIDAMLRRPRFGDPAWTSGPVATPPPVSAPLHAPSLPLLAEQAPPASQPPPSPAAHVPPAAAVGPESVEADDTDAAVAVARSHGQDGWFEHNDLWINRPMRLVEVDGGEVALTRSEFDLLAALMESNRRVRTKADLALMLRGESYVTNHFVSEADKRGIEVHLGNLRKKLGENPNAPRWIETVRGVGYRLTAAERV